jgi:hypothetical protein
MTKIDPALQAQVDAQLMEQGSFAALDFLISAGRLTYEDYERWRRRDIDVLDDQLMGNREKIRAQLEAAANYARSIGLVQQLQELHAWRTHADNKQLRISADPDLQRLMASRYVPAQSAPQMDLFLDNPVVVLTNGIVRALAMRDAPEAQRQLDRLYALAPNHADLPSFDQLLTALLRIDPPQPLDDVRLELAFLAKITPTAKRLLDTQARDLLSPLWRRLADGLRGHAFLPQEPALHRSYALSQAQDWPGVSECVTSEPQWWRHAPLCLRLAQSAFYRQQRTEALTAWSHFCWHNPAEAMRTLDARQQQDTGITALWRRFLDSEALLPDSDEALSAADFPAWLLLHEPGLVQHLPEDLPATNTPGEQHFRCVHRWVQARRANRHQEELALRKTLQSSQPFLFELLKRKTAV